MTTTCDRLEWKRGSGVAIYLRACASWSLPYKALATYFSDLSTTTDYLFLEVSASRLNVLLMVVYCLFAVNYFYSLESVLESLGSEYSHHIIMCDFNTGLLALDPSRTRNLFHIIQSSCLHVLPLQPIHHNIKHQDTWLDLILTSAPNLIHSNGQHSALGFSQEI